MIIQVATGKGEGLTKLSAFDAALQDSGVHNYNLIRLSSVVPPKAQIEKVGVFSAPPDEYGHRLYVVSAEQQSDAVGMSIGAVVGWYQYDDNRGMFVEHHLQGSSPFAVQRELHRLVYRSLRDMCGFRGIPFDEKRIDSSLSVHTVTNRPASVVVVAVYEAAGWSI